MESDVPITLLTLPEAAEILDPPLTEEQLRALVQATGLRPCGFRRTGGAGRPPRTYPAGALMRLHAANAPLIHEFSRESA